MGRLTFVNSDANPKICELTVAESAVPDIMAWYGAYYAGDRYSVTFNGQRIVKDRNGEFVRFKDSENQ